MGNLLTTAFEEKSIYFKGFICSVFCSHSLHVF
jgi:hypothetical protein